jgi:ATP-dependent Zn protease
MTDIKHTAYHEAGHAVIAIRLGYEVKKASIVRRQGVLDRVTTRNRTSSPDDIRFDLAGQLAEALVNSNDEQIQIGAHSDWRSTRRSVREFVALGFIGDQEGGTLIDELLQEIRALVRRDREAIGRVADALLTRKTLTGAEIKRIMEEVP